MADIVRKLSDDYMVEIKKNFSQLYKEEAKRLILNEDIGVLRETARIHRLRTDIYDYIQNATGSTNPRFIENTEFAMKLQTIENKLILSCYEKERELMAKKK